jgi:hypothetical protein
VECLSGHLKFDPFIRLHDFRLVVDNKTMTFCETSSDMMVQRWYLRIQHYNSKIVHLPGILNIVPDAGSRLFHLTHPVLENAQFCSLTSQATEALGAGQHRPARKVPHQLQLQAALSSRALQSLQQQLSSDSAADLDDASIYSRQASCDGHSQHAATLSAFMNGCAAHDVNDTASDKSQHSQLPDWATCCTLYYPQMICKVAGNSK